MNKKIVVIVVGYVLLLWFFYAATIISSLDPSEKDPPLTGASGVSNPRVEEKNNNSSEVKNEMPQRYTSPMYAKLSTSSTDEFEVISIQGEYYDRETYHYIYVLNPDPLVVPTLLSDYSFISIHNYHFSYQYYSFGETTLSSSKYTKLDSQNVSDYVMDVYESEDGYWGQIRIKDSEGRRDDSIGMIVHGLNSDDFEFLVDFVDKNLELDLYTSVNATVKEIPLRVLQSPNYTDISGDYTYYLPSGYSAVIPNEDTFIPSNKRFSDDSGNLVCLPLKPESRDPCGFSTSGCTCCNTGCSLLDVVLLSSSDGKLKLSGVLDKGDDGNPRFLYGEDFEHPWLLHTASFSSDNIVDYKKGVLDLIYLVESIERTF